jgi:hypothetical protein
METFGNIVLPWTYLLNKEKKEQDGGSKQSTGLLGLVVGIIGIIGGIYAGHLCWRCNEKEDLGLKVIYTIIAFFNAIPYLIYYLVIRIIIGSPCKCCGDV